MVLPWHLPFRDECWLRLPGRVHWASVGVLLTGRLDALPWGSVLFGFATSAVTAVVSLNFGSHELTLERGIIVGARAPVSDVDPVRLAIAFEVLASGQEPEARRRIAAQPERDELDVIAELAALDANQTLRLHRKVLARRAAATFSVEDGSYDVTDKEPASDAQGIEVHPIIYLGALLHAKQARLVRELERLGDRFRLRREGLSRLARFGFTDGELPILDALSQPRSIAELVAAGRPLGPQEVLSALYALVACDLCDLSMSDAKQRSRVNSKVSFRKKPVAVASPIAPAPAPAPAVVLPPEPGPPAQRVSGTFDLSAALSAELGDEPLAFELEPPRAPPVVAKPATDEPDDDEEDELERRTTNVIEIPEIIELTDPIHREPPPPEAVVEAVATEDSRAVRNAKRTQQLLAFVAVPRAPARKP